MAIVIAVLCVGGYVFAPKGDNQTYRLSTSKGLTRTEYGDIQ